MQTKVESTSSSGSDSRSHRWGLILAGGDGKRLLPLTRRIAGDDRPKQFCAVPGDETLLQQTQRRISRLVQPSQTLLVLTKTHEPFYAAEAAGIPSSRLLIQPSNQGTAPAILYSLLRLREVDPEGVVAFFPSDHHFSDDEVFTVHVDSACGAAESRTGMVILLGIPPHSPEAGYGWIEPGIPLGSPLPEFRLPRQPFLGKTGPSACFGLDRAWMFVEQFHYGWTCSRISKPHSARASQPGPIIRIDSVIVLYSARKNRPVRPVLRHAPHLLFSRRPIGAARSPCRALRHGSRLE